MQTQCNKCGTKKDDGTGIRGSLYLEILFYFACLVPGIIYTLWRRSASKILCDKCANKSSGAQIKSLAQQPTTKQTTLESRKWFIQKSQEYRQAGFKYVQWMSGVGPTTCDLCWHRNDRVFTHAQLMKEISIEFCKPDDPDAKCTCTIVCFDPDVNGSVAEQNKRAKDQNKTRP